MFSQPLAQTQTLLDDKKSWTLTKNSVFSSKSAYHPTQNLAYSSPHNTNSQNQTSWTWLWKTFVHPRKKIFLWQAYMKGLPTNKNIHKTLGHINDLCPLCNINPETPKHAIRDCLLAKQIWENLNPPQNFFSLDQEHSVYCFSNSLAITISISMH